MLATWMAYSLAISLLLGLAAEGLERSIGGRGLPRRGIWFGAMLLSMGIAAGAMLWPSQHLIPSASDAPSTGEVFEYEVVTIAQGEQKLGSWPGAAAESLESALIAFWISGSLLMLIYAARASWSLGKLRRSWRATTVRGRSVLVSRDTGPAVVGFVSSRIVVPEWVLEGDPALRDLMLAHEQEHLDAGDPRMLLAGLVMMTLVPWNLPLWWQLRRLRLAIELDCDARVLRRLSDPKKYASLLLDVGLRRSSPFLAVAAFSQKTTFLERRIRMITNPRAPRITIRLSAGAVALLMTIAACRLDRPTVVTQVEAAAPDDVGEPATGVAGVEEQASGPDLFEAAAAAAQAAGSDPVIDTIPPRPGPGISQQPIDTPGRVENVTEVQRNVEAFYPPLLRDAGVGGSVEVQLYVTAEGAVVEPEVVRSSGHTPLDLAGVRVARTLRFIPFQYRGENVGVWLTMPFTFQPPSAAAAAGAPVPPGVAGAAVTRILTLDRPLAPGVPPFPGPNPLASLSTPPRLSNMSEVQRSLVQLYPRDLLDSGISGSVTIRVYIGEDGQVLEAYAIEYNEERFVAAAEEAARIMEFTPAQDQGRAVPVWIELPVSFHTAP